MSYPFPIFGSENVHDDDGQVIDSFFIETDTPPDLKAAIEPIQVPTLIQPEKITRLFTGDVSLDPTWDPYLLLPADARRKSITIRVYSPTSVATDGVRFSDDKGNIRTAGKILHGGFTTFDDHNGTIYVIACGNGTNGAASAAVSIEFWSVTS